MFNLTNHHIFLKILTILLILAFYTPTFAQNSEFTTGYQLALIDEQNRHPDWVLLRRKITPEDAVIREFDWIIETLRYKTSNTEQDIVESLIISWRMLKKRDIDISLLDLSRGLVSFTKITSQAHHNQKVDFRKVINKWIQDKYPIK